MPLLPTSFLPFWVQSAEDHDLPRNPRAGLWAFLFAAYLAAFYGFSYAPKEGGWYSTLSKPEWTPANEWFGLIWVAVYTLAALSGWRIWKLGAFRTVPWTGIGWAAQIFLSALWSTLFFGLQAPWLAVVGLAALLYVQFSLYFLYRSLDSLSGWFWLPAVLWSLWLATFNVAIAALNA
jgi:translocator protein